MWVHPAGRHAAQGRGWLSGRPLGGHGLGVVRGRCRWKEHSLVCDDGDKGSWTLDSHVGGERCLELGAAMVAPESCRFWCLRR